MTHGLRNILFSCDLAIHDAPSGCMGITPIPCVRCMKMETIMLKWAIIFFIVAIIAGALGFGGIAGASAGIAQILFYVFLALLLISLVMHFVRRT